MADANNDEFERLMQRAQSGDEDAARQLIERFSPLILKVVPQRLREQTRPKLKFDSEEELIAYLVRMAENKVINAIRRYHNREHDVRREVSLSDPSASGWTESLADTYPSPSELVDEEDEWEQWMKALPPRSQLVLRMRRDGATYEKIAEQTKYSPRTIMRIVQQAFEKLKKIRGG